MHIINWQVLKITVSSYTTHSLPLTPSYLVVRLTQKLGDSIRHSNITRVSSRKRRRREAERRENNYSRYDKL